MFDCVTYSVLSKHSLPCPNVRSSPFRKLHLLFSHWLFSPPRLTARAGLIDVQFTSLLIQPNSSQPHHRHCAALGMHGSFMFSALTFLAPSISRVAPSRRTRRLFQWRYGVSLDETKHARHQATRHTRHTTHDTRHATRNTRTGTMSRTSSPSQRHRHECSALAPSPSRRSFIIVVIVGRASGGEYELTGQRCRPKGGKERKRAIVQGVYVEK